MSCLIIMQPMRCSRSSFARFNVACGVRRFNVSCLAATSYPKNKEWDYFKGIIPMSAVTSPSRRGFQGARMLAYEWKDPKLGPLKFFKDLMGSDYGDNTKLKLTDGSTGHKEAKLMDLRCHNLILFISSLDISDHMSTLTSVNAKVSKRQDYKLVWIPVVKRWEDKEKNDFVKLRSNMRWYTAQCFSPKLDMIEKEWKYKMGDKPIWIVMDTIEGEKENWKNGMEDFTFLDICN